MQFPFILTRQEAARAGAVRNGGERAFSLLELLVSLLIVAILVAFSLSVIQAQLRRAKAIDCVSRLRQIGVLLHAYAADNQMKIRVMQGGSKTSRMWYDELKKQGGLSDAAARESFGCPSLPVQAVGNWNCYGFRVNTMPSDPEESGRVFSSNGTILFEISVPSVSRPSKYFMMADTGTPTGNQTFRIYPPGLYSGTGIQARHGGRANVLFLDGHVELLDLKGLKGIGMTTVLDQEGVSTSTGP